MTELDSTYPDACNIAVGDERAFLHNGALILIKLTARERYTLSHCETRWS